MCNLMKMMEKHEREVRHGFQAEFRRMNWKRARVWGRYGVRLLEMRRAHREACADCGEERSHDADAAGIEMAHVH
jgi:hypothetical protein